MEILAALCVVVVVLAVVGVVLYRKVQFLNQVVRDLKNSPTDWAHTPGVEKSQSLIAEAQAESLKIVDQAKQSNAAYEQEYQKRLDQLSNQLSTTITANMDLIRQRYEEYIKQNEQKLAQSQEAIEAEMRTKVNGLLLNFEENLASFLSNSEQKSFEAINLELKSAKQLVESYKSQQLGLIDENIVAILERTLQLVLKERLALTNQLDLIYQSLEQAKTEKFFG